MTAKPIRMAITECFTDCIQALKVQNKRLTQELIDERVLTAQLTEQLEEEEPNL